MLLYVHKDLTDKLSILEITKHFVDKLDNRKHVFGEFSPLDLGATLVATKSKATQTN